jgi:hypothetical protein
MKISIKDQRFLGGLYILLIISFIAIYHAYKTPIMGDEALTLYLGTLPSIALLLQALHLGADSHGPFYHILNWVYQNLNYSKEQSFLYNPELYARGLSALFFLASLLIVYNILNKRLGVILSIVLTLTIAYWAETLRHIAEIRSYGFMFFTISLAVYIILKYANTDKTKYLIVLGACLITGSLSHPLTGVYIGAAMLTLIIFKTFETKKLDYKLIVIGIVSLAPYIIWLIFNKGQLASTMSESIVWERPPNISEFYNFTRPNYILFGIIFSIVLLSSKSKSIFNSQNYSLYIGLSFLTATSMLWIISQYTNPLFLERYIWPMRLGWVLISLGILECYHTDKKWRHIPTIWMIVLSALILTQHNPPRATTGGFWTIENPWADAGFGDEKYFREDLPRVCESSTIYLPRKFYFDRTWDYIMILDDSNISSKTSAPSAKGIDQKMSEALMKSDSRQKIVRVSEFLKNNPRFYLLNESFIDTDKNWISQDKYKRTLLNPSKTQKNQTLKIELIERL